MMLFGLMFAGAAFALGIVLGRSASPGGGAELSAARRDAQEARGMVGDLRETIWQHREASPILADVLLDDIRRFEETGRRPNPPLQ